MHSLIMTTAAAATLLHGCANIDAAEKRDGAGGLGDSGASGSEAVNPLPPFVDDCDSADNDDFGTLSGIESDVDGISYDGVQLCPDDMDYYRVDVAPGTWVSVAIAIDGSGNNGSVPGEPGTDLDLWEIEDPDQPVEPALDFVETEAESPNVIWYSASEENYERLAWYNTGETTEHHYLVVDGFDGANAAYDIRIRMSEWHDDRDCDEVLDSDEDGPCNRIMQFPQASSVDDGYLVTHWAHYSNLRREVAYLVRHAAAAVQAAFPGTAPLALMDMSEDDGAIPGTMESSLRHPEGTHVYGNDIDIAYYQNGDDNLGREVCPDNNGYFCTGEPTLLEPRRTALFMAQLMRSPYIRVIGVDPKIDALVTSAADDLVDEGLLESDDRLRLSQYTASGDGWPFHHHHMHFSWEWETGHTERTAPLRVEGCQDALIPAGTKVRRGPGR